MYELKVCIVSYVGQVHLSLKGCLICLVAFIIFLMENNVDPDQMPH